MIYSIPALLEKHISEYLAGKDTISYQTFEGGGLTDYTAPAIIVVAGKLTQNAPGTGVFEGRLAVVIVTQIDDAEDPKSTHDTEYAAVYDAMEDADAIAAKIHDAEAGHLYQIYLDSIEQERDTQERVLKTQLEYFVAAQNLTIPV